AIAIEDLLADGAYQRFRSAQSYCLSHIGSVECGSDPGRIQAIRLQMHARLREQGLVHFGSIRQGHVAGHTIVLSVLPLQLSVVQQCLGRPQFRSPVSQAFTVYLVGINVLTVLRALARLGYGLVQSALNSQHNSMSLDEGLLSSQHDGLLTQGVW